jgi:hypothetical protein
MASDKNKDPRTLFRRLTQIFRSSPVVRKKIKGIDTTIAVPDKTKSSGALLFQKSAVPSYAAITGNAYSLAERLPRFQDYNEMEQTAEISAMLDIVSDETVSVDDKGIALHIFSSDEKIRVTLEDLFYNVLNVEFNLRPWVRNLIKYGDIFLLVDVHPKIGVVRIVPIPVNEIEREENYDRNDPFAVRFRWVTMGNRTLENWEVAHLRLLGHDLFLPYGTSMIEGARRIWRQLILAEDAMLVYRVVRAPERRVFYVDVGNLAASEVDEYMQKQKQQLRTSAVIDKQTGRVDLRYNPMNVEEDYFIPTRGETGTKIDTLAGGQNSAAVEDVQYLQRKLVAALKIPRSYLGYEEDISSKSTLAQLDIRFSRTISVIQKTIIAEFNKIAMIHLYSLGYSEEDITNFTLRLSNPSTVAQQQKLELWRAKAEIANSFPDGAVSMDFIRREILTLSAEEIKQIDKQRIREAVINTQIEAQAGEAAQGGGGGSGGGGGGSLFGDTGEAPGGGGDLGDLGGEPGASGAEGSSSADTAPGDEGSEEPNEETPGEENSEDKPEDEEDDSMELLISSEDPDEDSFALKLRKLGESDTPVKPSKQVKRALYNNKRERHHGSSQTHMPDQNKMLSVKNRDTKDFTGMSHIKSLISNPFGESKDYDISDQLTSLYETTVPPILSIDQKRMLKGLDAKIGRHQSRILSEQKNKELSADFIAELNEIELEDN